MGTGSSSESQKGVLIETLADHKASINCMVLSEDESMIVTGSDDLSARMWSIKANQTDCIGVLR